MPYRGAALAVALAGGFAYAASTPAAQSSAPTICVAAPYAENSSASLAAPLRDAVVGRLQALNAHVVALDAGYDGALAEAATKNCSHIVMTKVQIGSGGGRFGMVNRYLRGKGQDAPPSTPPPGGGAEGSSLSKAEQQTIRQGQTVTLEYRLTPGRSLTPIKSDKLEAKASGDGEDVLGPLVSQVASAVLAGAGSTSSATPPGGAASDTKVKDARTNAAASSKTAAPQNQNIDCDQVAKASRGTFTVEACRQMQASQQAMTAAANDPSAVRPGDDKLTCDEIVAEMKQQHFAADKAKLAEAQAANADYQKNTAEEQKRREELARKESAETSIISQVAPTNAAGAANQKRIDAEQKAANEETEKKLAPKAERAFSADAAMLADIGEQMKTNPRMARLAQLASDKKCKVQ